MCLPKDLSKNVYGSFFHNSHKLETAQVSISKRMDKQIVVYLYKGVLLSTKRKHIPDADNNVNKSHKHSE